MKKEEILRWAEEHGELYPHHEGVPQYRCAATLVDGTDLPCVLLTSADAYLDHFLRRLKDAGKSSDKRVRRGIVGAFILSGSQVDASHVASLSSSPYAIPHDLVCRIGGETSMSWTQFEIEMEDGVRFQFGTLYSTEFFDVPEGYAVGDMVDVIPAQRLAPRPDGKIYRERPFFTCYV